MLASARSIAEDSQRPTDAHADGDGQEPAFVARATNLLAYIGANDEQLLSLQAPAAAAKPQASRKRGGWGVSGIFRTVLGPSAADKAAEAEAAATHARNVTKFIHALASIAWVPIQAQPSVTWMPWPKTDPGATPRVAAPSEVRVLDDAWLCSATTKIVAQPVTSSLVRKSFGWDAPLSAATVASQVVAMGHLYNAAVAGREDGGAGAAGAGAGAGASAAAAAVPAPAATRSAASKASTRVLQCYEVLAAAVMDGSDTSGAGVQVRKTLAGQPWVWVGDRFVTTDVVAFHSAAAARPYLFSIPATMAAFSPFLRRFGIRAEFGASDYLHVSVAACVALARPLADMLVIGVTALHRF